MLAYTARGFSDDGPDGDQPPTPGEPSGSIDPAHRGTLHAADPNGPATDAVAGPIVQPGEDCRQSDGPAIGGYTEYSPPLASTRTYVGLGHVRVPYVWTGAASATLNARLFDAAPDGTELLITRGTYRLYNDPPTGVIRLPFYGNHWRLAPGHRIRLDLTQVDTPTYHPSHLPSSIQFPQGVRSSCRRARPAGPRSAASASYR